MMTPNGETTATTQLQGFANQPRAIVLIDDIPVKTISIEITTGQFGYADTYTINIPLNDQPKPINRDYFAGNQDILVKIYIGYPPNPDTFTTNDLDLLMVGTADVYHDDLCSNIISINGRDLTSRFIDSQLSQAFPNQTSSNIVITLANAQGLTPQVTPTKAIVGSFYYNQQTLLSNQSSQWDLITFLAQQEGFVCFVQGETLVFEKKPIAPSNPYLITYTPSTVNSPIPYSNVDMLEIITNTNIASNVQVTVRVPYDVKTGTAFSTTVSSQKKKGSGKNKKKFVYRKPGLSPQQANQLAAQLLNQHISQGIAISVRLPGDNLLKKDSVIQLNGTGTAYDQLYYPDEIHRSISLDHGYKMYCYARNVSQDLENDLGEVS